MTESKKNSSLIKPIDCLSMGGKFYKFRSRDQWPEDNLYRRTWDANDGFFDHHIIVLDSFPPYENQWGIWAEPTVNAVSIRSNPHLDTTAGNFMPIEGFTPPSQIKTRPLEMHKVGAKTAGKLPKKS